MSTEANYSEELLLLAETLGEVKTRTERLEAEFATNAKPIENATGALAAALAGIKALQFHVVDNNLGALSARVEEMRKAVDEQVGVIALELKKADETNAAKAGADAEALRSEIVALQSQLGSLVTQFGQQLERVEFAAKEEAKKLQLIPGPAGASLNPRGVFIDGETYNRLDVVSWLGSSYIATVDGVTEKPSKNSNQWQVLASRGGNAGGASTLALTDVYGKPSNGQLLIGNGADYVNATLTAGNGIAVTNGSGSITIEATGAVNYQGAWNASTNSPTLTSSVGTKGYYYVVSVAGSTNLNGITDWQAGDWAVFNGTAWEKIDNTDRVSSVFGRTGAVVGVSTDYSSVGITNTAIGASNPSTGAFTTLSATGNLTANGGNSSFKASGASDSVLTVHQTGTGSAAAYAIVKCDASPSQAYGGFGFEDGGTARWFIGGQGGYVNAAHDFNVTVAGSYALTINRSSRNVLLGTTTDSSNGKLQLTSHTTSAGGIGFGTDLSLYRVDQYGVGLRSNSGTSIFSLYEGTTRTGGIASVAGTVYIDNASASTSLILRTNNGSNALTLDSSQNATFAGDVTISSAYPKIALTDTNSNSDFSLLNDNGRLAVYDETNSAYRITVGAGGGVKIGTTPEDVGANNLTVQGVLAIGNTVNTVSPTSPNRTITMVIGGTTYYLHAKTTND
jgi:hypothetical protein